MKNKPLQNLLFDEPYGSNGTALFKSQADIVRTIKADVGALGNSTEQTLTVYVNQVFRGVRYPSADLENAIIQAIELRLDKKYQLNEVASRFKKCLTIDESLKSIYFEEDEFNQLLEYASNAREHFILTLNPAETIQASTYADALHGLLLDNLVNFYNNQLEQDTVYKFFMPLSAKSRAKKFWHNIEAELKNKLNIPDNQITMLLQMINGTQEIDKKTHDKNLNIKLYLTEPRLCLYPTVVFNPDEVSSPGFVLFYLANNKISIARMSEDSVSAWKTYVYDALDVSLEDPDNKIANFEEFPYS